MPSKLLIAAAEARHHALHTDPFGIHLDKDSITVNGEEVMSRVKSERDRFVGFVLEDVEAWPSEKRIMGSAKFIDEHTVQIDDHTQIRAGRIIIARGGGSVDDLLPFSEEALQRAVASAQTPVVSAIGHEPDNPT